MSDDYFELLDATIQHLEQLKSQGVRFVPVSPGALEALKQPPKTNSAAQSATPARTPQQPQAKVADPGLRAPTSRPSAKSAPVAAKTAAHVPAPVEQSLSLPGVGVESGTQSRAAAALSPAEKAAAFTELRQRAMACRKCEHLASSRKNVVFGVGSPDADLMFVGEAPGADEDEQGEPFVGKAGQLLTRIIQTMGLSREMVYIANILKCRPDTPGQASGNRKPTPEEMQTCIPFLHEQIDLIKPKVIVALGATAVEGLLGKTTGITRLRGNWRVYRGIPLMPTYHPAYLLRNQALSEKRNVWEDMLKVMEKLGMEITDKHRNYFLKG